VAFQRASRGILLARKEVSALPVSCETFTRLGRLQTHNYVKMADHLRHSFGVPVLCKCLELMDAAGDFPFYTLAEEAKSAQQRLFWIELDAVVWIVAAIESHPRLIIGKSLL